MVKGDPVCRFGRSEDSDDASANACELGLNWSNMEPLS